MKIRHFAGYGSVNAVKVKDSSCTLHVKVTGNHEWGLVRDDEYDLFNWLVKKFDKGVTDYMAFHRTRPVIRISSGYENGVETCDYLFCYRKEAAI